MKSFDDTKEVMRAIRTNNTMVNQTVIQKYNSRLETTQKTKDWSTRTPIKTGDEFMYPRKGKPAYNPGMQSATQTILFHRKGVNGN